MVKTPQAIVTAIPCSGPNAQLTHLSATRVMSTDLPAEALGEVLAEAIHNAWTSGIDPAIRPFHVIVKFE